MYKYVESTLLTEILSVLSKIKPPKFGENFSCQISSYIQCRDWVRYLPNSTQIYDEPRVNFSAWSLPVMFEWLPANVIIWVIFYLFELVY